MAASVLFFTSIDLDETDNSMLAIFDSQTAFPTRHYVVGVVCYTLISSKRKFNGNSVRKAI